MLLYSSFLPTSKPFIYFVPNALHELKLFQDCLSLSLSLTLTYTHTLSHSLKPNIQRLRRHHFINEHFRIMSKVFKAFLWIVEGVEIASRPFSKAKKVSFFLVALLSVFSFLTQKMGNISRNCNAF